MQLFKYLCDFRIVNAMAIFLFLCIMVNRNYVHSW